ncbi:alpha/beta fold hydrolase [Arcanobacterium haemolyticum]|nr:alpha/beta fold hydrolase [Arcanobacterium haemolyticum]
MLFRGRRRITPVVLHRKAPGFGYPQPNGAFVHDEQLCSTVDTVKLKLKALAATLAASSLLLAGCTLDSSGLLGDQPHSAAPVPSPSSGTQSPTGTPITGELPAVPAGLEKFYTQEVAWEDCNGSFQCATIEVPLDYTHPEGATIKLSLLKRPAKTKAIGSLFINPGGPGGSGIDMAKSANYYFGSEILNNFDIIGFDPRGVGKSTPVDCVDDETLGRILDTSYNPAEAGWQEKAQADQQTIADGCAEKSGELLPFVGTVSVARDLDVMRHLVGDPKLYYAGFSYGTSLGGQYADLFPANVGRMILDGAVDTSIGSARMSVDQTLGFETALRRYMEDCMESTACPFTGTVDDGLAKIREALDTALTSPYPTGTSRPLTQSLMFSGIIMPLYNASTWSMLTQAFTELFENNRGTMLLKFADMVSERNEDGSFASNSSEANWAINCADYPAASADELAQANENLAQNAPVFGTIMTAGPDICSAWHYKPEKVPGTYLAKGSAPIVVVGTTYDPATPYAWAEAMHEGLENSVLVTWEGDGHTAYGSANDCLTKPLDAYLLEGTVPDDGLTCTP